MTKRLSRRNLFIVIGAGLLFALTGFYFLTRYTFVASTLETLQNADSQNEVAYGATLFQTRGCAGCHTLDKAQVNGDTGPNLTDLGQRMSEVEIRSSVVTPNKTLAETCPEEACQADIMPDYGRILNDEQVAALVSYLKE
jgi:mono/diheme cytochrome c family protein